MRFNPGGLLRSAIEVSDLFISAGRIVSTKGRNTPERVWDAQGNAVFEDIPLVVLVNHYSASASEIVSACLQDHKRAVIMGERTWGKGSVQNIIALEDGRSALKLTTAAYQRPSGKNIHRFPDSKDKDEWGVMPDLGYELGLDARETRELLADRRNRDIIAAHATGEKSATAPAAPARLSDKPAVVPPESPASQRPGIEDKYTPLTPGITINRPFPRGPPSRKNRFLGRPSSLASRGASRPRKPNQSPSRASRLSTGNWRWR